MGSDRDNLALISFHGSSAVLYWGRGSTTNGLYTELRRQGDGVLVGEDCMFATEIVLRPTDMHAVFDLNTGRVINNPTEPNPPIILYPHVWLGQRVTVLKGVTIGPGAIVGASALVTKDVPPSTAVGGNPARMITEDVTWTRASEPKPEEIARVTEYVKRLTYLYSQAKEA
ncbi:acyltransferase [Roseomonas marmotae]|uniref:Acyltransferase n=2 Tax=Roseomonas marmotae TaxID=2768161 RepID=A0ABS3K8J1_9PROT|nr:acyltransferase [Roseomonas marmotae]QTI80974.1 acyltransferase [Roseomonas marmotae]